MVSIPEFLTKIKYIETWQLYMATCLRIFHLVRETKNTVLLPETEEKRGSLESELFENFCNFMYSVTVLIPGYKFWKSYVPPNLTALKVFNLSFYLFLIHTIFVIFGSQQYRSQPVLNFTPSCGKHLCQMTGGCSHSIW